MAIPFIYLDSIIEYQIANYKRDTGLNFSKQFLHCAEPPLIADFERQTGLKINKNISMSCPAHEYSDMYVKGPVSRLKYTMFVNHNWNVVTIAWKSKSGVVYDVSDENIDCDDIEFWFEGLDVLMIHKQLFPGDTLPFKLKGLSYELAVTRLNLDCTLQMALNENAADIPALLQQVDDHIDGFNTASEKKGRRYGVIHNWKHTVEARTITYEIDMGSTGPYFFKKLLPFLSQLNCFERVEIC